MAAPDAPTCPVCEGGDARLRYRLTRFQVLQCAKCDVVYLWPRLTEDEVRELFSRLYTEGDGSVPELKSYYGFTYQDRPDNPLVQLYERWLGRIEALREPGRVLDIGCGTGLFLAVARRRGWQPFGVDDCREATQHARDHFGLDVWEGEFSEAAARESHAYDLITMWDIIEHARRPVELLQASAGVLAPGGLVALSTPNQRSVLDDVAGALYRLTGGRVTAPLEKFYIEQHFLYFTPDTLEDSLRRAGLGLCRLDRELTDLRRLTLSLPVRAVLEGLFAAAQVDGSREPPVRHRCRGLGEAVVSGVPRKSPRGPGGAQQLERLRGWGGVNAQLARLLRSEDLTAISAEASLSRGLGSSYGDASLPAQEGNAVADTTLADRIVSFDPATGRVRAEAGLTMSAMKALFLSKGWFPPVTPGTGRVTLGGMVAADVHGKNHHRDGSFGRHVRSLKVRTGEGSIVECSPEREGDLFFATTGGMGLTGHVLEVEFDLERVPSPWIWQEVERTPDFEGLAERLREASRTWNYTVAWADLFAPGSSFGRGVVLKGRWAEPGEAPSAPPRAQRPIQLPIATPRWALNQVTGRLFYALYRWAAKEGAGLTSPDRFFHPLDALTPSNRVYGPKGYIQYQCVLPNGTGLGRLRNLIQLPRLSGHSVFLCVLKDLGDEGRGTISFPRRGLTLSLDIPYRGEETRALVDRMNDRVAEDGGRFYLAKDAFSREEHFRAMEPRHGEWRRVREKWDPSGRLSSALSVRLLGDEP